MLDHVSYSGLSLFNRCPKAFEMKYMSDLKPAARLDDNIGSIFHRWAEEYGNLCASMNVQSAMREGLVLARTYGNRDLMALAETFTDSMRFDFKHRETHLELKVRVPLGDGLPEFLGYIDLLEYSKLSGTLTITDYKTPPRADDPDYAPDQLKWYAWAVLTSGMITEPINEILLRRWVVPEVWNVEQHAQVWEIEDYETDIARQNIVATVKRILATERFEARPSEIACQYCDYKHHCEYAKKREFSMPQSREEAVEMAGRIAATRSHTDDMSKLLKEWVRGNGGTLRANGYMYGDLLPAWLRDGKIRYQVTDARKFIIACEKQGIDWTGLLSFDSTKVARELKTVVGATENASPFGDDASTVKMAGEFEKCITEEKPKARWGSMKFTEDDPDEDEQEVAWQMFLNPIVGDTSLHDAAWNGDADTATSLINGGADVDAKDHGYCTPLQNACAKGSVNVAEILIARGARVNEGGQGSSPLHYAASVHLIDVVNFLIAHGADINAKDKWGCTALHEAARNGCTENAKLLIEHNANIEDKDESGYTPLHIAAMIGWVYIVELLIAARGADVNAKTTNGSYTPLHLSARENKSNVVRLLIEHGAKIDETDGLGRTPLQWAKNVSNDNIALLLAQHGAQEAT